MVDNIDELSKLTVLSSVANCTFTTGEKSMNFVRISVFSLIG